MPNLLRKNASSWASPCPHLGGRRARPMVLVASLLAVAAAMALGAGVASAAISHEYLSKVSETLSEGVPAGCGEDPPSKETEERCLAGPLMGVNALTAGSGHVWVAERFPLGHEKVGSRVDEFDAASGGFVAPQLDEEGEVKNGEHELGNLLGGVAVGEPAGEQEVYVGAAKESRNVVAVFGPSGRLQPEGVWEGKNTPDHSFERLHGIAVERVGDPGS